jgi:hypothetical protein
MYIRCPPIRKQNGHLVDGLWYEAQKVPKGIRILAIGSWVSFLGVNKVGKFAGISDEEDWCVVPNHIPIALLSVKLYCKPTGIPFSVRGALFSTDS